MPRATIPAKFETIFHIGKHEEKGFGSRAVRFAAADRRIEEDPGPGAYRANHTSDGSVGQRGNTAFASRTPRLGVVKPQAPGPGAYESEIAPGTPTVPSAAFVPPSSVNPFKFNMRPTPGPGHYNEGAGIGGGSGVPRGATTRAPVPVVPHAGDGINRFELPTSEAPGPGHYNMSHPCSASAPAWRSGHVERRRKLVQNMPETAQFRHAEQLLSGKSAAAISAESSSPGPGEYETDLPRGLTASVKGTSSFVTGNSHLPRSWKPVQPGPGAYDPTLCKSAGVPASASFVSNLDRFKAPKPGAPGPAYYSPKYTEQNWV